MPAQADFQVLKIIWALLPMFQAAPLELFPDMLMDQVPIHPFLSKKQKIASRKIVTRFLLVNHNGKLELVLNAGGEIGDMSVKENHLGPLQENKKMGFSIPYWTPWGRDATCGLLVVSGE